MAVSLLDCRPETESRVEGDARGRSSQYRLVDRVVGETLPRPLDTEREREREREREQACESQRKDNGVREREGMRMTTTT